MKPFSRLSISVVVVSLFLTLPAILLIPMSLSSGSTFQLPPPGWSTQWYENLVTDPQWRNATITSLKVSLLVTPLALGIGTMATFGLFRLRDRFRDIGIMGLIAPLIIPNILIGLAVYATFLRLGLSGTMRGLVLGQTCMAIPFVIIAVAARLRGYDRALTSAAQSLGATPVRAFWGVTFPLILPGIVAGGVFAFVSSFDELVIALLLQGPSVVTLPVQMFNAVTEEADPTVSAASTVLMVLVSVVVMAVQLGWVHRRPVRR